MNYAKLLRETSIFKSFPEEHLQKLAALGREDLLQGETVLFHEGDAGDEMFVIAMGTVRVLKKNRDGHAEEVAVLGTRSYFGEMAIVLDDHKRTATIIAKEPSTLVTFRRGAIEQLCDSDAAFGLHFYRALARGVAQRLDVTTQDASFYKMLYRQRHTSA